MKRHFSHPVKQPGIIWHSGVYSRLALGSGMAGAVLLSGVALFLLGDHLGSQCGNLLSCAFLGPVLCQLGVNAALQPPLHA